MYTENIMGSVMVQPYYTWWWNILNWESQEAQYFGVQTKLYTFN